MLRGYFQAAAAVLLLLPVAVADARDKKAGETRDLDPNATRARGVGIEGTDISRLADSMMRDILASPAFAGKTAPQVLIDADQVTNESSQRINKSMIVARLRNELNRASNGRFTFVDRMHLQRVMQERELKRSGEVDMGTTGLTRAVAGVDYQLTGAIYSTEAYDNRAGALLRTTDVNFELLDMERSVVVWSSTYTITRESSKDISYR